jgi:adenosylhomocysteine nucleosidase
MTAGTLLGIVAAFEPEAVLVRRHLCRRYETSTPGGRLWRGVLYGQDTVLLRCGMGAVRATCAATWLVQHYALHGLLNIGFAGGLQASLTTGDALLPEHILAVSHVSSSHNPTPMGSISPDACLAHLAATAADQAHLTQHRGTLVSVSEVLVHAATKQQLGQHSGALAVDMESYSIGQVAVAHALPFMTIRTIFDTCEDTIPFQVGSFTSADGVVQPLRAWGYLVSHPRTLLHIGPAWCKARRAGRALASWLHYFLPLLRHSTHCREDRQCLP